MITSKCPLRISLVGGSTDLDSFIDYYGKGSVISFPCNLYVYVTLMRTVDNLYNISYSKHEVVLTPDEIDNDIIREVIKYFSLPPVSIVFNSDIQSSGSGLASSSAYLIALIEAVNKMNDLNYSQFEICDIALKIERNINPMTGYQDTFGCGIGGLKRINFLKEKNSVLVNFSYLKSSVINSLNMYLIPTNIHRSSTDILHTIDIHKSFNLLECVDDLFLSLDDSNEFHRIMNEAWQYKKNTSDFITTTKIDQIENELRESYNIQSLKLCGAGSGGYFLILTEDELPMYKKIKIDNCGTTSSIL